MQRVDDMSALRGAAARRSLAAVRRRILGWTALFLAALIALPVQAQAQTPPRLRARHVLVAWKGAKRAGPSVIRTKEDARRRATTLLARAKSGTPIAELAREGTDDPGGRERGGDLGATPPGALVPELERALLKVKAGQLVPELVESPFGFHVAERLADAEVLIARQVLVTWSGALRAATTVKRTRDEARAEAATIAAEATAGVAFETFAARSDDAVTKANGGLIGEIRPGTLLPSLDEALRALAPGAVSAPIETPFGFHVLQRLAERPSAGPPQAPREPAIAP